MKGATMSEIIKCPICHKMAGIRYDINRVYQSRCQNMECRETVTVTAPSEAVAEELFYRFEKGTNQPQLTIHQNIADELDDIFNGFVKKRDSRNIWTLLYRAGEMDYEIGEQLEYLLPDENQVNIGIVYLAGKALGVDLVKVVEG